MAEAQGIGIGWTLLTGAVILTGAAAMIAASHGSDEDDVPPRSGGGDLRYQVISRRLNRVEKAIRLLAEESERHDQQLRSLASGRRASGI